MSPSRPLHEKGMQNAVHLSEGRAAAYGPVVIAPALDDRVQGLDERLLWGAPFGFHYLGQSLLVEFHLLLAGLDDGLEAESPSAKALTAVVLPHRELPHSKAEEIEPGDAVHLVQGVADPGLTRFQFQAHALEPLLGDGL